MLTKLSFVEAACIKSYLLTQNPGEITFNDEYTPQPLHHFDSDAVYFHTNIDKLSSLGKYWKELYQGENITSSSISF